MSNGYYGSGKRQREQDKSRKKRDKAERRQRKREMGPQELEVTSTAELMDAAPSPEEAMRAIAERAAAPKGSSGPPCRLFVGGLSWDTNEETLRKAFGEIGTVADAFIVRDRTTGDSRGFGFVTMENGKDAGKAIESLHDSDLDGRNIVVNVATERER